MRTIWLFEKRDQECDEVSDEGPVPRGDVGDGCVVFGPAIAVGPVERWVSSGGPVDDSYRLANFRGLSGDTSVWNRHRGHQ